MSGPTCFMTDDNCTDLRRHPEWVHATSAQQVVDVVETGAKVYDNDGDTVRQPKAGGGGSEYVTYQYGDGPDAPWTTAHVGHILLPVGGPPVSDADVQAAIASITGEGASMFPPRPTAVATLDDEEDPFEAAVRRKFGAPPDAHVYVDISGGNQVQIGDYTWDTDPYEFSIICGKESKDFDDMPSIWRWLLS